MAATIIVIKIMAFMTVAINDGPSRSASLKVKSVEFGAADSSDTLDSVVYAFVTFLSITAPTSMFSFEAKKVIFRQGCILIAMRITYYLFLNEYVTKQIILPLTEYIKFEFELYVVVWR